MTILLLTLYLIVAMGVMIFAWQRPEPRPVAILLIALAWPLLAVAGFVAWMALYWLGEPAGPYDNRE